MNLSELLQSSEEEVRQALEQGPELAVPVATEASVLVRHSPDEGYFGDLRVKGETVVIVRAEELPRFRQRLKEQIAIHVSRDEQPDLTR